MKRDPVPGAAAVRADGFGEPVAAAAVAADSPGSAPVPPPPLARPAGPSYLRAHRWQWLAALVVLIGGGAWATRWWIGPQVATATVLRRDFVQTVVASGRVEAPHRLDIGVQITGTVRQVPVAEGQAVQAGDLLIALEAAELNATGRQADVAVVQAQAKLRQL